MTRAELTAHMKICHKVVAATLSHMKRKSKTLGKRVYVKEYVYDDAKLRYYPRAVYALGCLPDAKRPKSDPTISQVKYREKIIGRFKMNNVFNLGLTNNAIKMMRRAA